MGWCAGVCVIWLPGYTRNTASLWMNRRSAERYGLWVTGSYRHDHVIMPKTPRRGRYLKKIPNPSGGNQEQAPGWNDHRNLVAGRGQGRAKNKDYPALGKTGDASLGPQGSANSLGIYLWRYLPGPRCRRCPDPSKMQYCRHDTSSTGNIRCCCSWSTCHRHRRSSRMALLKSSGDTGQYYLASIASKMAGTQSGREHLAIHAR